jgi:hypothetical protein
MVGLSENTAVCKSFIVLEERQGEEFLDSATGHVLHVPFLAVPGLS